MDNLIHFKDIQNLEVSDLPVKTDLPFGIFNIELTNECPMRCVMCPRTENMTRAKGYLSFSRFCSSIDQLSEENRLGTNSQPVWLHHFGESLLSKKLFDCISYASKRNIRTGLSINPFVLTDESSLRIAKSDLDILYISLDGHNEESFRKIRGLRNAYDKSIKKTLQYLKSKKSLNSKTQVTISMIDFELNSNSIEATKGYWKSVEGVDNFLMKTYSSWDGSANGIERIQSVIPSDKTSVQCKIPWQTMTILWDGRVVPCCNDYDGKLILGTLDRNSLSEIWNGQIMQDLRRSFIENRVQNPLCRDCERLRRPQKEIEW